MPLLKYLIALDYIDIIQTSNISAGAIEKILSLALIQKFQACKTCM